MLGSTDTNTISTKATIRQAVNAVKGVGFKCPVRWRQAVAGRESAVLSSVVFAVISSMYI